MYAPCDPRFDLEFGRSVSLLRSREDLALLDVV